MSGASGAGSASGDERFAPGAGGPLIAYEHVHRYALAARVARGRRILDLACGSGYGSRMLGEAGGRVIGLDLARVGLREAGCGVQGSAAELPFADGSFDLVVCFEAIEHLEATDRVADEIRRVLAPGGVALISTPDRAIYSDRAGLSNAHHVSEMTRAEFDALLRARFGGVVLYGQSVWAGSWISRLRAARKGRRSPRRLETLVHELPAAGSGIHAAPWAGEGAAEPPEALYLLALCSREPDPARDLGRELGSDSLLHDPRQWLVGEYFAATRAVVDRDREIESQQLHARNQERSLEELRQRPEGLEQHAANLEAAVEFERNERASVALHAENLAALVEGAWKHAENLQWDLERSEGERASTAAHSRNLEAELARVQQLREGDRNHAGNLEAELARVQRLREGDRNHAGNLEAELCLGRARVEGLEAHARNLQRKLTETEKHRRALLEHAENVARLEPGRLARIEGLTAHIANLDAELVRVRREWDSAALHARNLEQRLDVVVSHREGVLAHVKNLEAAIAREQWLREGVERHALNLELLLRERDAELGSLRAEHAELGGRVERERREAETMRQRFEILLSRSALELERAEDELERIRSTLWFRLLRRAGLAK